MTMGSWWQHKRKLDVEPLHSTVAGAHVQAIALCWIDRELMKNLNVMEQKIVTSSSA